MAIINISVEVFKGEDTSGNTKLRATIKEAGRVRRPNLIPFGFDFDDIQAVCENLYGHMISHKKTAITMRNTGCDSEVEFSDLIAQWEPAGLFQQTPGKEVHLVVSPTGKIVVALIKRKEFTDIRT